MGLDIYFYKKEDGVSVEETLHSGENVGYLRKVNVLYGYCESNTGMSVSKDDITYSVMDRFDMVDIVSTAEEVLIKKDSGVSQDEFEDFADSMLPYTEGFFFGCYDYGDGYIDQLKALIEEMENILSMGIEEVVVEFNY